MSKVSDVMTQSLATCSPEDTANYVATIMRDRDIGDVLVVEAGKLRGIITDRDLAIHALTDHGDPQHTPIRYFMSDKVVTGNPDWSTARVARTMAKHQIRRLPIVQDDELVGIISLSDIARNDNRKAMVTNSLKAISSPHTDSKSNGAWRTGAMIGLGLVAMASTAVALLTWNRTGKQLSRQVADSDFFHSAQQAVNSARDRMDEAASSKTARNMRQQVRASMKELSNQLPRIEYKPPKHRPSWMRS